MIARFWSAGCPPMRCVLAENLADPQEICFLFCFVVFCTLPLSSRVSSLCVFVPLIIVSHTRVYCQGEVAPERTSRGRGTRRVGAGASAALLIYEFFLRAGRSEWHPRSIVDLAEAAGSE